MTNDYQTPPLAAALGQPLHGLGAATAGLRGISLGNFEPMASLCSAVELRMARAALKEYASLPRLNSPTELRLAAAAFKEYSSIQTILSHPTVRVQPREAENLLAAETASETNVVETSEQQAAAVDSSESGLAVRLTARLEAITTSVLNLDATSTELGDTSAVSTASLDTAVGFAWRNREDLDSDSI